MRTIVFVIVILILSQIYAQEISHNYLNYESKSKTIDENYSDKFNFAKADNVINSKYPPLNQLGQVAAGLATGIGFSALPIIIIGSSRMGLGGLFLGILIGGPLYLLGSSTGVYWVAKPKNPDISYWSTFGFSCFGGLATIIAINTFNNETTALEYVIALLLPSISSMLYASYVAEWPNENQQVEFINKNITHKDFIKQTELFNLELIRIRL